MTTTDLFAILLLLIAAVFSPGRGPTFERCAQRRVSRPRVVRQAHGALVMDSTGRVRGFVAMSNDQCVWERYYP